MEFTIVCPIDGTIEVGLEDVDNVVLKESDRADITFVCPHCGSEITVTAIVPAFLLSAIEALADEPDGVPSEVVVIPVSQDASGGPHAQLSIELDESDPRFDAYCEYFRRQLSGIECVEDALEEIDSRTR